jgi:hypothetical protein
VEVRVGQVCPRGFLPVYSTDTEEEARRLVVMCCSLGAGGRYYANEVMGLDGDARIEGFNAFGRRLAEAHARLRAAGAPKQGTLFEEGNDHTTERR